MTYHPDLHPYDVACNETTHAAAEGRKRYEAAVAELQAATLAQPALDAAERAANARWVEVCRLFRSMHGLPADSDLGPAALAHLPARS